MTLIYTGIGSRETPKDILIIMEAIGRQMGERGHILRSGGADGADQAFEKGCDEVNGKKEIYLPWPGFRGHKNGDPGIFSYATQEAQQIAAQFHPNWAACDVTAKCFHSRNTHQIAGWDCDTPTNLVICWTPNASGSGGTGQALRIAKHLNIPIFDLADPASFEALDNFPGI